MLHDDDIDILTLFSSLPCKNHVCGHKRHAAEKKNLHGKLTNKYWYEIVRTAVPYQSIRETERRSCGIPSRVTCDEITTGTYPWYCMYTRKKRKGKEEKRRRDKERRNTGKKENEKRSKHTCGRGAGRVPRTRSPFTGTISRMICPADGPRKGRHKKTRKR